MDVKHVNPFIQSFGPVMSQMGFAEVRKGNLSVKGEQLVCSGIIIIVGIAGELRGNVVYTIKETDAKKIASKMMMGMSVQQIDEMAKSALSELSNMLTANAATCFSQIGIMIDISTPTLLQGTAVSVNMNAKQVLCISLIADDVPIDVHIAFET